MRRQQQIAESRQEQRKFIEENRPALEAIMEAKRVQTYFKDLESSSKPSHGDAGPSQVDQDEKIKQLVHQIKRKKEIEQHAVGWDRVLSKNETLDRKDHPVLLSRDQVAQMALEGISGEG